MLACCIGALIVLWALLGLAVNQLALTGLTGLAWPGVHVAVETSVALASLFGALVLSLFPADRAGVRLGWVAGGFLVMGAGALVFGVLEPLLNSRSAPGSPAYVWLVTRSAACLLFVAGLVPAMPPRLPRWTVSASVGALAVALGLAPLLGDSTFATLPGPGPEGAAYGIAGWYWSISLIPLGLSATAVAGAFRWRSGTLGGWLLLAMVLLAGSQFHSLFWPSAFSPLLSTVDILRLCFAGIVAVGGIFELRRLAAERAALLSVERENNRRLGELAALRADFTAMVAHELSSPLTAIRAFASVLTAGDLGREERNRAGEAIEQQAATLEALVSDVRAAAAVERDDFSVNARPVMLDALLSEAAVFARALPGGHPVEVVNEGREKVLADAERIGQVVRNLLTNAAKFSPEGGLVEIRAHRSGRRVRMEVADRGPGIHPDDMGRVFEKFGRGRDRLGRPVPGVGLGLYLSRRIVQAHGSELGVESAPGEGTTFFFYLEVAG